MTKKDYEAIARVIKRQIESYIAGSIPVVALITTAREMATMFSAENPRFDTGRFLRSCGIQA